MTPARKHFKTVDEYLESLPEKDRRALERLRQAIKKAAPEAEEYISYQMPGYNYYGMLAWFAAFKDHYGFYMRPHLLQKFRDDLIGYELRTSAIRFPIDKPIPVKLIMKIVKTGAAENLENAKKKGMRHEKKR